MREVRPVREIVQGARCPGHVLGGLPCPGRLLVVRNSAPGAGPFVRYRCNGPDAHVVETYAPVATVLPQMLHVPAADAPQVRWS
jgi:hypothetical protein